MSSKPIEIYEDQTGHKFVTGILDVTGALVADIVVKSNCGQGKTRQVKISHTGLPATQVYIAAKPAGAKYLYLYPSADTPFAFNENPQAIAGMTTNVTAADYSVGNTALANLITSRIVDDTVTDVRLLIAKNKNVQIFWTAGE